MEGTRRGGEGGEEPAMWPRIWFSTKEGHDKKVGDNCLRVLEERLLWSYYMIFDSCQTRNVIMYDTLSQGKGNNNNDKWDEENEKKKTVSAACAFLVLS